MVDEREPREDDFDLLLDNWNKGERKAVALIVRKMGAYDAFMFGSYFRESTPSVMPSIELARLISNPYG